MVYDVDDTPVASAPERVRSDVDGIAPIDVSQAEDMGTEDDLAALASIRGTPTSLLVVRTDAALPQRRTRRDAGDMVTPDDRLLAVLGRAASANLPPVSALGVETALEAMADASKLAVAADLGVQSRHLVDRVDDEPIWL